ncbi:GNAT family N-acetyltransferase [Butyrivibrio sp. AE3004]|uniref:GNAT family N-acetyltransferase n=1 Tax=Butyrivibrio sp. AE3004 TaxID=1506994 RepID=UPI000691CD33|nr:GNAT family N-acetyltransferase [Butyrivibrio sp. AE3004]
MEKVRLETHNLVIKKAEYGDWEALYKNIWSKSESAKHMLWTVIKTEDEAKERMKKAIKYQEQEKYALIVYLKETMEAIGWTTMHEIEPGIFEEDGIAIGLAFVGKGYGKQILNALCDEASRCGAK